MAKRSTLSGTVGTALKGAFANTFKKYYKKLKDGKRPTAKRAGQRRPLRRKMSRKSGYRSKSSGTTDTRAVRVSKHKKGMPTLKKKIVKVPPKLRAQVKQVLSGSKPKGFFKETHQGLIDIDILSNTLGYGIQVPDPNPGLSWFLNKQFVFGFTSNTNWAFLHWTFNEIVDAACVLFYNKINKLHTSPFETNDEINFRQNFEARPTEWPVPYINAIQSGLMDTPFKVVNSNVTYEFLNNSHHFYECELVKCSPKKLKAYQNSNIPAIFDWSNALLYENQGQNLTTPQTVYPGGVDRIGIAGQNARIAVTTLSTNVTGHTVNEFGIKPSQSPMWNAEWKSGETKFTLEPGQRFKMYCQGPKNATFDAKKWSLNRQDAALSGHEAFQRNFAHMKPHWSEEHILIVRPINRPSASTTGQASVFPEASLVPPAELHETAISIQCTKSYTIEMPETTGTIFQSTVSGLPLSTGDKQLPLANRKRSYYYNYWRYDTNLPNYTVAEQVYVEDPSGENIEDD